VTIYVNKVMHIGSTTTLQVVGAVGEHALVQLPSLTLSNSLGELNRINGKHVLNFSLCTPSRRSRAFQVFDGLNVAGVSEEASFRTAMAVNQAHWWTGDISTQTDGPLAEHIGRHWMALADPGTSNYFFGHIPAVVDHLEDTVVNLVQSDGFADSAIIITAERSPVAESGAAKAVCGTGMGIARGVEEGGEAEMKGGEPRRDGDGVLEEASLTNEEMTTEALMDDLIRPEGMSSTTVVFSTLADLVKVNVKKGTLLFVNNSNVFM